MQRRGTRTGPLVATVVTTLVLGAATACSGGDDDSPAARRSSTPTEATVEPAPLVVRSGSLQGFLPRARHDRVVEAVGEVVDGWIEEAWVAGPWPREVTDAWSAFTTGAARNAERDAALTSGAHYAGRVDAVLVTRREVRVDLLARRGTAYAATVRVVLDLDVTPTDEAAAAEEQSAATASSGATSTASPSVSASQEQDGDARPVKLRGRVFLTRGEGGWKIFGHDLARGGW